MSKLGIGIASRGASQVLLVFFLAALAAVAAEPKRVLVVHSFVNAAPPFTTHSIAFESTLSAEMGRLVDLDEVSLDVARYASLDMEEALVELMRKRHAKWQPDLVVPIGSPAGIFVAQYRDRLFPGSTPVIYAGMDQRRLPPGALEYNATFVGESFDFGGMVEDILAIAPATTNIAVVIGASPLESYWLDVLRQEYRSFTSRVSFTWFNQLSFDKMLEQSARLPPHSFILLVLLMRDATGVTHNADEALRRIHAVANAPITSIFDHQLGLGIVGGRLYQAELEGAEAARIAARVLRGESMSKFPPKIIEPLEPRYDWRELQRWNISEQRLPRGSVVLFHEPTVWKRYRAWIIAGASALVAEAIIITLLLANLIKRRQAETDLRASQERMDLAAEAAQLGLWLWDIPANTLWLSEKCRELFALPNNGDLTYDAFLQRVHPEDRSIAEEATKVALSRKAPYRAEYRLLSPSHRLRWITASGRVDFDAAGRPLRLLGICIDASEQRRAEEAAREVSGRLINAQEEERRRIARDLHDDLNQQLALISVEMELVGAASGSDKHRNERMERVAARVKELSSEVHKLSYHLHPAKLDQLGLVAAARSFCRELSQQSGVRIDFNQENVPRDVRPEIALCLYRIIQESLQNMVRHSGAEEAKVQLQGIGDDLALSITDLGNGFDIEVARRVGGLGLISMEERVRLVRGSFRIDSQPGSGTQIVVAVPLVESPKPSVGSQQDH